MLTTILFDFFGTLVDYEHHPGGDGFRDSHRWFLEAGGRLGYEDYLASLAAISDELEAEARRTHAEYPLEAYAAAFLGSNGLTASRTQEFIDVYIREWNTGVLYSEEVHEAVQTLAGRYFLGVVTNTHLEWLVPSHLERMGIAHHFPHVVTSIGHGKRKPDAEIFHHALRRFDCAPEHALFVGDSLEADYHGARNAGIRALLIDPACTSAIAGDHTIRAVSELPGFLGI